VVRTLARPTAPVPAERSGRSMQVDAPSRSVQVDTSGLGVAAARLQ
jgi:hypothetical protein